MKLYRTPAGHWAGTQEEARALAGKEWDQVEVPTDKPGLLAWLNANVPAPAVDPDPIVAELLTPPVAPAPAPAPSYAERSIALEEAWEALPLSLKLHFAALAMEAARAAL